MSLLRKVLLVGALAAALLAAACAVFFLFAGDPGVALEAAAVLAAGCALAYLIARKVL